MTEIKVAGYSHKGRRGSNEDSWFANELNINGIKAIITVADGMGGMAGGEVASHMAVRMVKNALVNGAQKYKFDKKLMKRYLEKVYERVNCKVYEKGNSDPSLKGMGTTLTTFVLMEDNFIVANLGDSRAYHVSEKNITQLTEDHNALNDAVKSGTIDMNNASSYPYGNALTKYIGDKESFQADLFEFGRLCAGDKILICTDGFYKYITEETIVREINTAENLDQALINLAYLAFKNGSDDNITLAAIEIGNLQRRSRKRNRYPRLESILADDVSPSGGFGIKHRLMRNSKKIILGFLILAFVLISLLTYQEFTRKQERLEALKSQLSKVDQEYQSGMTKTEEGIKLNKNQNTPSNIQKSAMERKAKLADSLANPVNSKNASKENSTSKEGGRYPTERK